MSSQLQLLSPETKALFVAQFPSSNNKVGKSRNYADKSLDGVLNNIFPSQKVETRVQKTRRVLGDIVADLSDQELESYVTEFSYLLDSWLDEFERSIFDNKTLKELLQEG